MEVESFLSKLSSMDANNAFEGVGVGEREGRVACPLVYRRHFGMAHGMGRSGDLSATQPKAPGSSVAVTLAAQILRDALRISGLRVGRKGIALLPVATGMAITLALLSLRRRSKTNANKVVWSRIDQKTCIKCVSAAGLELVVVPLKLVGDELRTDVEAMVKALSQDDVLCAITTTSCFAPRAPDDVCAVARACRERNVPHLVNHAYGLQSRRLCESLSRASREGRVDAFVSSLDKNFMVPVGGSIIARVEPNHRNRKRIESNTQGDGLDLVQCVNADYPGRASSTHAVDVLATLLWLGRPGWTSLLAEQERLHETMLERCLSFCSDRDLRVLRTPENPISMAIGLIGRTGGGSATTFLGSQLYHRNVSGARVVDPKGSSIVDGIRFQGFGSHHDEYPVPYIAMAASIGATSKDVDGLFRVWSELHPNHPRLA